MFWTLAVYFLFCGNTRCFFSTCERWQNADLSGEHLVIEPVDLNIIMMQGNKPLNSIKPADEIRKCFDILKSEYFELPHLFCSPLLCSL